MQVYTLTFGPISQNCYIAPTGSATAVVVDPGYNADKIKAFLDDKNLTLTDILLTHGHPDHIGAAGALKALTRAKIHIHEDDAPMLLNGGGLLGLVTGTPKNPATADAFLKDGQQLRLGEKVFTIMHTPGHTPGGVMVFCKDAIFSGDTLFYDFVGRTDLPGGDTVLMKASLKKIAALTGDYTVYPGHDQPSTLAREQRENAYLKNFNYDFYD